MPRLPERWRKRCRTLRCKSSRAGATPRTSSSPIGSTRWCWISCGGSTRIAPRRLTPELHVPPLAVGGISMIDWLPVKQYTDILYDKAEGIAKITINRPEVHNAFRPLTLDEMQEAFEDAHADPASGVVLLTGAGGQNVRAH